MQPAHSVSTPIALADIFPPEAIVIGLEPRSKRGVIETLAHHLVERRHVSEDDGAVIVESVLARERMASTALGGGIAVPHCRSSLTEKFIGVLGIEPRGIPFDALDGEPVECVFLLVGPLDGRDRHYEVLGRITAIGRDKSQRLRLAGCRTAAAAHQFLAELDRQ